jgi:hypothetical protein
MPVPTTGASPKVKSQASFAADPFTYDPLFASDVISMAANIAAGQGVLPRGTVLLGPVHTLAITTATPLTHTPGAGLEARAILAQDTDTTGGQVQGLVYIAGNFLDTALSFTTQGASLDAAQLWLFDIHVMTVEGRSGQLIPMMSLPTTGSGPLPQEAAAEAEEKSGKPVHPRIDEPASHSSKSSKG